GLKRAVVTLPPDLGPNTPAFANTCAPADFDAGSCPAASIVGDAIAASPLQAQPLTGPVVLITPPQGSLPVLGLDLRGALALKLKGQIALDGSNPKALRTQVTFDGLPDIPISDFTLTFAGGDGGINIAGRSPCTPPPFVFDTTFFSHAGGMVSGPTEAQATCQKNNSAGKKPRASVKLAKLSSKQPQLRLKVRAGSAPLRTAKVSLPRGLKLAAGRAFTRGTEASKGFSIKHSGGSLSLKAKKKAGVTFFKVGLSKGALRAKGHLKKGLRFGVGVRDVDGKATKLKVRAK
nr:hypothetical protein [Solirubrobacterales bacterium]